MRANPELMSMIGYISLGAFATCLVLMLVRNMTINPILARIMIFLAMVVAAMLIIIGVASVSHAAECLPSARAVWAAHPGSHATWNVVDDVKCYRVGYGRNHHSRAGAKPSLASSTKASASHASATHGPNSGFDSRDGSHHFHWKHPEHAKLFEEFQDWLYLGKR